MLEFENLMAQIQAASAEATLLQRLVSGDVPKSLEDLQEKSKFCAEGLTDLQSHSLLMPLNQAVSMVNGKSSKLT